MRKWKPITSGVPYTCKDCPALAQVIMERDYWREVARKDKEKDKK